MKRSAPLKRSAPPPRSVKVYEVHTPRAGRSRELRMVDTRARMRVAVPKTKAVRSDALIEACRILACQHCGANDGTVCAAHSNWSIHGKSKSRKADDAFVASLCARCHSAIDQGSRLSKPERQSIWWGAHVKTVRLLVGLSLWPAAVAVPDTSTNPFI